MKLFLKDETIHNVRVGEDLAGLRIITAELNIQDVHDLGLATGQEWLVEVLRRQMVPGRRSRDPQGPA